MTPVREWIKSTLLGIFPNPGAVWSDINEEAFFNLTGLRHKDLLQKWFQFKEDGTPDYDTKGPDPKFTTCTSFLPRFATQVCRAGAIPEKMLRPFKMAIERGYSPAWLRDAVKGGPEEGDFFLTGHNEQLQHVGVIVQVEGSLWSVVGGGAGGRTSRRDGVKRTPLQSRPAGVLGYLNVDIFFEGWGGLNAGE